jgi:hypothetical protein
MHVTRRKSLALIGSAVAAPLILRTDEAAAAPFEKVFGPKALGATAAGTQGRVRLAGFKSDASILATWTNFNASAFTTWFQYFSKTGTKLTNPIQLDTSATLEPGTSFEARPLSFADGTALIFFFASRKGAPETEGSQLFVQRMSANRKKVGKPIRINDGPAGSNGQVFAAQLTDNNVMVIWQHTSFGPTGHSDVVDRVITKDGAFVTSRRRATLESAGNQTPKSIAALSQRRAVFSYTSVEGDVLTVACQRLNRNGARVGDPIVLKTVDRFAPHGTASVASVRSIGSKSARQNLGAEWDAYYYAKGAQEEYLKVRAERFAAADGEIVIPAHSVFSGSEPFVGFTEATPQVILLPDGQSVIFSERRTAGGLKGIRVQVHNIDSANPSPLGPILISTRSPFLVLDDVIGLRNTVVVGYEKSDATGFDGKAYMAEWFIP